MNNFYYNLKIGTKEDIFTEKWRGPQKKEQIKELIFRFQEKNLKSKL